VVFTFSVGSGHLASTFDGTISNDFPNRILTDQWNKIYNSSLEEMTSDVSFTIKRNDQVGRYAVAGRDLKPGDLILTDLPFAYGPKAGRSFAKKSPKILTRTKSRFTSAVFGVFRTR
jgi:hypothetical protein